MLDDRLIVNETEIVVAICDRDGQDNVKLEHAWQSRLMCVEVTVCYIVQCRFLRHSVFFGM